MHLGVCLVDHRLAVMELAQVAATAESIGYERLWTNESGGRDPFAVLAAFADVTTDAGLGIGVSPIYARPPLSAAAAAATLADATGRDLIFGIGSGVRRAAERAFGVTFPHPLAGVADYAAIVQGLLRGEEVTFDGAEYEVVGARIPLPAPLVRVVVGAMGPKMVDLGIEATAGVLLNWSTPEELAARASDLRAAWVGAYVRVAVAADGGDARRRLATEFARYLRSSTYRDHAARLGHAEAAGDVDAAWQRSDAAGAARAALPIVTNFGIAGTPPECVDQLEEYRDLRLDELVIRPVPVGDGGLLPAVELGTALRGEGPSRR